MDLAPLLPKAAAVTDTRNAVPCTTRCVPFRFCRPESDAGLPGLKIPVRAQLRSSLEPSGGESLSLPFPAASGSPVLWLLPLGANPARVPSSSVPLAPF